MENIEELEILKMLEEAKVSFALSTDDDAKIPNHLCIVLLEHGFKIVK